MKKYFDYSTIINNYSVLSKSHLKTKLFYTCHNEYNNKNKQIMKKKN